ncbi:hypothetical protein Syun_004158 [Stephania yunnanensis]|uniref:Uncharacterized protein n=1 Tax=Stephania yunnanensis TaxID=152371 RepID=A0AAP0Q4M9_9MAGN
METIVKLDHEDGVNDDYKSADVMESADVVGSTDDSGNAASYVDENDRVESSDITGASALEIGMVFDSLEDVKFFFKQYGKRIKYVRVGRIDNVTFNERDIRNYIESVRRLRLGNGDAEAIQQHFMRKQKQNPNFFHFMALISLNELRHGKDNNVGYAYQQVIEIGDSQPPLKSQVEKGKKKNAAPSKKLKRKVVARNKMGLPPPSRHEYEEVLNDRTDVIREKNFEKFEPEESVDCEEEMSSDDDDCEDLGKDDSEEGFEEEIEEFMGENEVGSMYQNLNMLKNRRQSRIAEDRPLRLSLYHQAPIVTWVPKEVIIAPTVVIATHSHFSYGQFEQQHQPNSKEGHTHDWLNQPRIMDVLTSLKDNVEEIKVVVQQTCVNLRAEHKATAAQSKRRWKNLSSKA